MKVEDWLKLNSNTTLTFFETLQLLQYMHICSTSMKYVVFLWNMSFASAIYDSMIVWFLFLNWNGIEI